MTDFYFIDVRTEIEFIENSIENSINIPMHLVPDNYDYIKNLKGVLVFFCRSGNRSGWVTDYFKERGIDRVLNGGSVEEALVLTKQNIAYEK